MSNTIDNLLHEARRFPPNDEFAANAVAKPALYESAAADRLGFWADQARELLHWHSRSRTLVGRTRRSRSGSTTAS